MMQRGVLLIVTVVLAMASAEASADLVNYVCEVAKGSSNLKPIVEGGACIGFRIRDKRGQMVQGELGFRGSGFFTASKDGRSVVFVHYYPYATLTDDNRVISRDTSEKSGPNDGSIVALAFFRDGKLVNSYKLDDLLFRKRLVFKTVSHVLWLGNYDDLFTRPIDEKLTIQTTSFRRIAFEARSGKISEQEDTEEWKRCDIIASGIIVSERDGLFMKQPLFAKTPASVKAPLLFSNPKNVELFRGQQTVCLKRNKGDLVLEFIVSNLMYNKLTERKATPSNPVQP